MNIQCFSFIFWLLIYLLPVCYSGSEPTPTAGPFKTSISSVQDCSNPRRPYLKNPPMFYHPWIQNVNGKNMLGGNLTVLRDTREVKMKFKSFVWRDGKWCLLNSINNLNCHGAMLYLTFAVTGVKYDKKNCMFLKGFYSFQNLDVNQLQHIWVPSMPYARLMWRVETFSKDGMFICKEFDTVNELA